MFCHLNDLSDRNHITVFLDMYYRYIYVVFQRKIRGETEMKGDKERDRAKCVSIFINCVCVYVIVR